jgi:hypothetical protein
LVGDVTGSIWNVLGQATSGQLAGSRLPAVVRLDTSGSLGSAFYPETRLVE